MFFFFPELKDQYTFVAFKGNMNYLAIVQCACSRVFFAESSNSLQGLRVYFLFGKGKADGGQRERNAAGRYVGFFSLFNVN